MESYIVRNARIINEGNITEGDLLIRNGRFEKIGGIINDDNLPEIDFKGNVLIPGIIDDQVHFREPGLTHKANIRTESMAAAAGGVTSFMEMPNTNPPATTIELLEQKYAIAAETSVVNYSFFLGTTNDNLDELLKANYKEICGIKIFMGSSTGNLLVDNEQTLDKIFANAPALIATHCEDEKTILDNLYRYKVKYGENITPEMHPLIRNAEGCYISSSKAISLAKKHNTRLHILHISTAIETELFENKIPLAEKRITSEACVHHLYFNDNDYKTLGNKIKCNPAIKTSVDQSAVLQALLDSKIDIIATDHAPHTEEEKAAPYLKAPSGLPLIQHTFNMMLSLVNEGKIRVTKVVELMCHAPAICFKIKDRGFIREGYMADFVQVDFDKNTLVDRKDLFYKCGWSPLEGIKLPGKIVGTWVNGTKVFESGKICAANGNRLKFDR